MSKKIIILSINNYAENSKSVSKLIQSEVKNSIDPSTLFVTFFIPFINCYALHYLTPQILSSDNLIDEFKDKTIQVIKTPNLVPVSQYWTITYSGLSNDIQNNASSNIVILTNYDKDDHNDLKKYLDDKGYSVEIIISAK